MHAAHGRYQGRRRPTARVLLVIVALAAPATVTGVALRSTRAAAAPPAATVTLAYATSFRANTVSVIDTATNKVVATIPVGSGPEGVAFTPDGTRVYVPNELSGTASVIDTATNTVFATVPVGTMPFGVAVTPDGTRVYVTNQSSNSVSVIDTATNTVTATLLVGAGPYGVAVTPDGSQAYVANQLDGTVSVIDTATETVTATVTVGTNPSLLAVTPDGSHAWVTNLGSATVSVIDTSTNAVTATVPAGTNPRGVAFTANGTHAYIADANSSGTVTVVDTATDTVADTINVGQFSAIVALSPDGGQAYVTDSGSSILSVIDTATNTVTATIPIGQNPAGVAVAAVAPRGHLSLFYAVPSPDGSTVTIGGLVQDAPNTPYSLQITSTSSCSQPGSGVPGVPDLAVTTNSSGYAYFDDTFPTTGGIPTFVYLFSASPLAVSDCYPVGADNTAWENAAAISTVGGAGTTEGTIALPGESRWYKFQATPDSQVTVTLSGLSDNYAVAVYDDLGQASAALPSGTSGLDQLSAESASSTFSPSAFIPSAFIPSAFIPSAFIPSAFIPSAFIPSAFIPSAFIPSAFTPSSSSPTALLPGGFTSSAFPPGALGSTSYSPTATIPPPFSASLLPSAFNPLTYSSALSRSVITYNDEGGLSAKTATVNTWQATGSFYIQVTGNNGAYDPGNDFQISVNSGTASCPSSVVPMGSPPPAAPAVGVQTVILTDSSRLSGTSAAIANVTSQLQTLSRRPEVAGTVVDMAGNGRVRALNAQADANPGCVFAKNLVASAIRDVVNSYRANNPLKYVVIAGPDNVVPFFRHPDQTLIGNETGYNPPVANDSASDATLRLGYTLTDNDYGSSIDLISQSDSFPVPDLAVGRLVETASEISGMLQAYLGTQGGVLPTPTSSLVTGYDFLDYPAESVAADLAAGTGKAPDTLIAPQGAAPAESWTATQLKNAVLDSGRHDIVFLAGHFSANDTLAADYETDMITTDMAQSTVDLVNSLVFSAGCHSGYNIVNGDAVPNVTLTLDWPEEFAQKQATLIGGTGYQYGDTDFIAYSEQIYASFAHLLRQGSGPVPIGEALLQAKQDYLTNTADLDAMGQKAVYEAELYGLPMASINLPDGRIPAPSDTSVVGSTTAVATNPGSTLGLRSAQVSVTPNLTSNTVALNDVTNANSAVSATYLSGDDGVTAEPYQPVLPVESDNVSVPGESLRGAVFLGGSYTDTPGVTPLTGAPATEIRGVHTGFQSSVFYPEKTWNVNYFDALDGNGTGATRLVVTPVQDRSDPAPATTDTRRQFSSMNFALFYSNNTTTYGSGATAATPFTAGPPQISKVQSRVDASGDTVFFCATIGADPVAGVQDAYLTYTDPSAGAPNWTSLALTQGGCNPSLLWSGLAPGDSTSWGGQLRLTGLDATSLRFLVQAVSGAGLVSVDDNLGQDYPLTSPPVLPDYSILQNVQASATSAPFGASVTVSAQLDAYNPAIGAGGGAGAIGGPIGGEPVTFAVGTQSVTAITGGDGVAEAMLPLTVAPGAYSLSAAAVPTDGVLPSSAVATQSLTVTEQPTLLTLAPTGGTLPIGQTSYTATLCALGGDASATACGPSDAPVADRTVVFKLGGPVSRTEALTTDASGQVQFNAYGLPAGAYTLNAYFDGNIPGVGVQRDSFYAPPATNPATAMFATTTTSTVPPKLQLPANIVTGPTGPGGAVVTYAVSATDPVDPRPAVSCLPGPATLFPVGTTTVNCQATDTAGLSSTGSFTVTVAGPFPPGTATCNGAFTGSTSSVVVPSGATCVLVAGTTVAGNLTVQAGGSLRIIGATVGGNVTLQGAGPSLLCGVSVAHNLTISNAPPGTATTVIGDTAAGCTSGDTIAGNVTISSNQAPVDLSSTTVGTKAGGSGGGHVTASGNTALLTLSGDRIETSLAVHDPGPVVIRNCTVNGKPVG
jgi:YVTN family beta-propeller protein